MKVSNLATGDIVAFPYGVHPRVYAAIGNNEGRAKWLWFPNAEDPDDDIMWSDYDLNEFASDINDKIRLATPVEKRDFQDAIYRHKENIKEDERIKAELARKNQEPVVPPGEVSLRGPIVKGKINLDKIPASTRPEAHTKGENAVIRINNLYRQGRYIKPSDMRTYSKELLRRQGIEVEKGFLDKDIVSFGNGPYGQGVAIFMIDLANETVGYYAAINLDVPNGYSVVEQKIDSERTAGIWHAGIVLGTPSFGDRMVGDVMLDKYKDDITKYKALCVLRAKEREDAANAAEKHAAQQPTEIQECPERTESTPMLSVRDHKLYHLPYVRFEHQTGDLNYPVVEANRTSIKYVMMSEFARLMETLSCRYEKEGRAPFTYILSSGYVDKMHSLAKDLIKRCSGYSEVMNEPVEHGVLVWNYNNIQNTLIYQVYSGNSEMVQIAYLENDQLVLCFTKQKGTGLRGDRIASYDAFPKNENVSRRQATRTRDFLLGFLLVHIALENGYADVIEQAVIDGAATDEERTVVNNFSGQHESNGQSETLPIDVVYRDTAWFNSLYLNREIDVRGHHHLYWCGSGNNRHLEVRYIQPYKKGLKK